MPTYNERSTFYFYGEVMTNDSSHTPSWIYERLTPSDEDRHIDNMHRAEEAIRRFRHEHLRMTARYGAARVPIVIECRCYNEEEVEEMRSIFKELAPDIHVVYTWVGFRGIDDTR